MLSGKSYYQQWHQKFGQQVLRANDLMQTERRRFMIAQKSKNGIYVMDAEIKHMMRQEGVIPNVYVVPDKFGIYISMVSGDALEYKEQGNKALVNREYRDNGLNFRGTKCFEAQSFDVEFNSQPVDLLTRRQQVGSWYVLPAPSGTEGKPGYDSGDRYIYSADSDSFEKIERVEAWRRIVNMGKDNKAVTTVNTEAGNLVDADRDMVNESNQYKTKVPGEEDGDWDGAMENSDILLFRPNQTFNASSAILAKGGSELGNTYHGHHDFMLSDDVVRKVHVGHYTFYSKSVIKRPKNYVIIENIMVQGYIGGMGTKFHTAESFSSGASSGDLGRDGNSFVAVAIPKGRVPKHNVLDITGRFSPSIYDTFQDNSERTYEHYPGAGEVYNRLAMQHVDVYAAKPEDEYLTKVKRINTVLFRGHEMAKIDGVVKPVHLNTGHLGTNIYPGLRKVLDGEMCFVKDMEWESKIDLV